jgi:hypothetical protein
MNVKPFIWLLVPLSSAALAQDYNLGVRAQALGGSGVAHATDPEGQFTNPATLAQVPGKAVTIFYSRPFGIKEITLSSVAASAAFGHMSLGVAVAHLGQAHFEDQNFHLALALKLSFPPARGKETKHLLFGVQSAWRRVRVAGYETRNAGQVHAGLIAPISQRLAWGAALSNVLGFGRERPPSSIAFGLSYRSVSRFSAQMDLYKQSRFPHELRAGAELIISGPLLLRVGMATNPDRFTAGLALALKPVTLHFTTFSHDDLGWTQQYAATVMQSTK